ncbi:MAG: sensor histidine kinase [Planctomycetota bacterium]
MNKRPFRRHLLALCTFLVPLGVLAWIGHAELGRQAGQVRAALDREALQFLRAAAQALEQRFDRLLPTLARESEDLLAEHGPAGTVRQLRARGFGAVLDLVLVSQSGRLRYPEPASARLGLPFHRDAGRDPLRGDDPRPNDPVAATLHAVDLLLLHERFDDAARQLRGALAELDEAEPARRRVEQLSLQVPLLLRLGTIERRRGDDDAARAAFERARDGADDLRGNRFFRSFDRLFDHDALVCGLLAETALCELDDDPGARLALLAAIADGRRDHLGDALLQAAAERLAAALDADAAATALAEVGIHLHTRAFAADYGRYLRETVRRRLNAPLDPGDDAQRDLRQVITAGNPSALLLLRPAVLAETERADWIGLRLDLGQLLASAVEPFVRGDGSFVLAIADGDGVPVVAAPAAPDDFAPPALQSHGMMLRAYPADLDGYLADARAADRNTTLLVLGLFAAAVVGALWLWRTTSRESELLELKVDLVSRVSHELKTPLSLISLYGETLAMKRARDDDQAAQFGAVIAREASRLTAMIQRILDFSRHHAGTRDYSPEPTDLQRELEAITRTYEPHLAARGAHLGAEFESGVIAAVDREAFAGAVMNLLDNAVKYARDEDPDLELQLVLRRDGDHAVVSVLDRGRGVPPRELRAVFDSFYRASNAGEVRGAGIGLSLVRLFAEAHGGRVVAEPRPGGGSIFRIHLPVHRPAAAAGAEPPPPAAPESTS